MIKMLIKGGGLLIFLIAFQSHSLLAQSTQTKAEKKAAKVEKMQAKPNYVTRLTQLYQLDASQQQTLQGIQDQFSANRQEMTTPDKNLMKQYRQERTQAFVKILNPTQKAEWDRRKQLRDNRNGG